jgi:D-arabinose 1-dehydrogenase-like Zn-dependent alcohol dehydrogenase
LRTCRRGWLIDCRNLRIPGISYDGGYADAMVAPADALAAMPDQLSAVDAAPLLCAGVTTFNALRHSGAMPGDIVAVLGIGGLGHLGVQFANKLGFCTVAIARGSDKEGLSRNLGAHHFIDSATEDVAASLNRLGGARAVLATVTSAKAMTPVIEGLAVRGRLIVVGVDAEPIEVSPLQLIGASRSVVGHAAGASIDSQDTLGFSALSGVRPMIETMPPSRAPEAYARMMRAEARFRMVLTMAEQH